jgi:hypothetical protein
VLHIVYRSYGGENTKGRPPYYSKLLALASFVRAFGELNKGRAEVIYLNDGPIPTDRLRLMERSGEVLARAHMGLEGSIRSALALPAERHWPRGDLVWLAEDDYLYQPRALTGLVAAAEAYPEAAYFALYALIGNRLPNGTALEDERVPRAWRDSEPRLVDGHPWRQALSTTSTFGGRIEPLLEDRRMMHAAMRTGGAWDHTTCLMYQGFQPFPMSAVMQSLRRARGRESWWRRVTFAARLVGLKGYQAARALTGYRGRLLIAPDPALITHLETAYLALGTDWTSVAESTRQWAEAHAQA